MRMELGSEDELQPQHQRVSALYSEDNGKTFALLEEIKVCKKCKARTIICPHKCQVEEVIKLPTQATHVKIVSKENNIRDRVKSQSCVRMEKLVEDVKFSLLETLTALDEVWDDIGIKDDQKEQRCDTVSTHLQDLLGEMLAEESELKVKMQLRVEDYNKELDQLYTDLHMPRKPNPPNLTLVNLEIQLRNDVDTLNKEKHDRLKWLRRLRAEEQSICEELVMTQHEINFVGTPTLEQLRELEQNVSFLKTEKNKRSSTFETARKDVIELWSKLEIEPVDEFENKIKQQNSMFILSIPNLEKVKLLKDKLERDHTVLLQEIEEKRKQYNLLRDRLEEQLNVLEKGRLELVPAENTISTLKILDMNIDHLQKLKRYHLQSFIQSIRKELEQFWNKCYFGEEQRRLFSSFYTDDFTEQVLGEHEHQLNTMKHYYENNKEIFKLICRRETLWEEKLSLESNDEGNARFKNRGGALIKALKKKEYIDKQLPKLGKQLKSRIGAWENENDNVFLYNDKRYLDHIESQGQDYADKQKMKKDEKQQAKKLEMSPCGNKVTNKKPLSALKRVQTNNSHNGNLTHSIYRSPLSKRQKTQVSINSAPSSTENKRIFKTTPSIINSSKYTHSSLQNNENQPKAAAVCKKKTIMSKLTTESMRKSYKRRSIKASCRGKVLMEKNMNMETPSFLNVEMGKGDPNISLLSYNDFSNGVAELPCSRSSFIYEPSHPV